MSDLPGNGLWGWLGRQFGYVSKAVKHDPSGPKKIFRNETVVESPHPEDAEILLRRTTIDEAITRPKTDSPRISTTEHH